MKSRKRWLLTLVVILIVALSVGGVYRFAMRRQRLAANGALQRFDAHTVSASDIVLTVQGNGAVAAAETVSVTAPQPGTVRSVEAKDGDRVKAGDVLATVELPELENEIAQLRSDLDAADQNLRRLKPTTDSKSVESPVDGLVKIVHVQKDDLVDTVMAEQGALMVISVDRLMTVTFTPASAAATSPVTPGQSVKVAIGAKTVDGRVRAVAPSGAVTVQFEDNGYDVAVEAIVRTGEGVELGRGQTAISQPFPVILTGGTVQSVSVKAGASIDAGDTLLRLTSTVLTPAYRQALQKRDQLAEQLTERLALQKHEAIVAPAAGIVSGLKLNVLDALKKDQAICSVVDDSKIELTMNLDELDVPMVALGQKASVTLDALPGRTYQATVSRISAIGSFSGGVASYPVTVTFDQPAGVLAGMSANATITVLAGSQVPVIPLAAMQTIDNRKYVLLADALNPDGTLKGVTAGTGTTGTTNATNATNGTTGSAGATGSGTGSNWRDYLVEVTVGRSTDNGAEIVSGIKPGDRIAIASSTNGQASGLGLGMGSGMGNFGSVPRDLRPTAPRTSTSSVR